MAKSQKVAAKKAAKKVAKKIPGRTLKQRVTGQSSALDLREALKDAVSKLKPPPPGSDTVTCDIVAFEVTVGGFTNIPELVVTLVSR